MKLQPLEWTRIDGTSWEIMTNGTGELFIRHNTTQGEQKEIRLTPDTGGFQITDWNTPGKLTLDGRISVR